MVPVCHISDIRVVKARGEAEPTLDTAGVSFKDNTRLRHVYQGELIKKKKKTKTHRFHKPHTELGINDTCKSCYDTIIH